MFYNINVYKNSHLLITIKSGEELSNNVVLNNMIRTIICVAVAGTLFISAVYYDYKFLFIVAAFFDWLPLPTRWMKIRDDSDHLVKKAGILHGVVTIMAYIVGIIWLVIDRIDFIDLGYLFLIVWFQAVMLGLYTTIVKLLTTEM